MRRVRFAGPRGRGNAQNLVRSRPKLNRRFPPSPWIGQIIRFMKPSVVADYNDLATGGWTSAAFYDTWYYGSPVGTFGGRLWDCRYHLLGPPASSANGAESSVVLDPIRFTIAEPSANDDSFSIWDKNSSNNTTRGGNFQLFAQDAFLPASGNSHMSAGKPTQIHFSLSLEVFYHAANLHLNFVGNNYLERFKIATNWWVVAKYIQFRKNGSAYGTLVDNTDLHEYSMEQTYGVGTNRLSGSFGASARAVFPSAPASSFPDQFKQGWEFEFEEGDVIEADVWLEAKIKNDVVPQTLPLLVMFAESNQYYGERVVGPLIGSAAGKNGYRVPYDCAATISGIKSAFGLDPSIHTYEFTPANGTVALGKAQAPALIFDITSKRLLWRYDSSSPASAGVTFTTIAYNAQSPKQLIITFTSVAVGAVVTLHLSPDGADFSYTSTTTNTATFASDFAAALASFISSSGSPWADVTINPAGGSDVDLGYPDDQTMTVSGTTYSGGSSAHVTVELNYDEEMAWLAIRDTSIAGFSALYRPQSSGDYINQVYDAIEGTINTGPTGCFDHLGTTVFELWRTAQTPPYDGRGVGASLVSTSYPTSVTVEKVSQ
jgi:hypothetical protein